MREKLRAAGHSLPAQFDKAVRRSTSAPQGRPDQLATAALSDLRLGPPSAAPSALH